MIQIKRIFPKFQCYRVAEIQSQEEGLEIARRAKEGGLNGVDFQVRNFRHHD